MATPNTMEKETKPRMLVFGTIFVLNFHVVLSAGLMMAPVLDVLILSSH